MEKLFFGSFSRASYSCWQADSSYVKLTFPDFGGDLQYLSQPGFLQGLVCSTDSLPHLLGAVHGLFTLPLPPLLCKLAFLFFLSLSLYLLFKARNFTSYLTFLLIILVSSSTWDGENAVYVSASMTTPWLYWTDSSVSLTLRCQNLLKVCRQLEIKLM